MPDNHDKQDYPAYILYSYCQSVLSGDFGAVLGLEILQLAHCDFHTLSDSIIKRRNDVEHGSAGIDELGLSVGSDAAARPRLEHLGGIA